jgi:hypothetical protein
MQFPSRFRALTTVPKYDGETNPNVWLEDCRLACHAGERQMISSSLRTYFSTSST